MWDRDGVPRDLEGEHGAGVVELTGLLRTSDGGDELPNWPADMRILCRRERPSAGAQLCALEEADGWRYQLAGHQHRRPASWTSSKPATAPTPGSRTASAREGHRPRTTCRRPRWRSTPPGVVAAMIATDLLCWSRCSASARSREAEPKTLRYRLLHTAARIVRGQRKRKIKIPETWPWAHELAAAFALAFALTPT